MKDKRPPGKGGPRKSAQGAAGYRGKKDGGPRSGGPRSDAPRPGGQRFGGPKRPREEGGVENRRFDGPRPPRGRTDGDRPRANASGGGDRPFDRHTERPAREPRGGGRPEQSSPRGRKPFPPRDGAQRFDRGKPEGGQQESRSFRRRDDGADAGRSGFAGNRGAGRRFERGPAPRDEGDQSGGDQGGGHRGRRSYAPRGDRPPRDERAPRFDRDRPRDGNPRDDRDAGGRERSSRPWGGRDRNDGGPPPHGGKPKSGAEQRIVGREKAKRAQSVGEGGALWLYGKHAVAAALANPKRKIKRLLTAEGALAWLASVGVAKERAENAEQTSTDEIDLLLHPGAVHQGLAALVEDLPRARLREECSPEAGFAPVVVLDQITDPQNIGAIMRSAAAFGAKAVIVQDRRTPPLAGALAKAAAGAVEQIACVKVVNVARAVEGLKDLGYYCAGLAGEAGAPIGEIPKDRPVALVLGAEGEGLRRLVAETCDGLYRIPIAASVDSLNVSTAAAVSLYAVTR